MLCGPGCHGNGDGEVKEGEEQRELSQFELNSQSALMYVLMHVLMCVLMYQTLKELNIIGAKAGVYLSPLDYH